MNGGFADYVLADPNYVGVIPRGLGAAPVLCAGVTVYKGIIETDTKPGDTVVISGVGGGASGRAIGQGDGASCCGCRYFR